MSRRAGGAPFRGGGLPRPALPGMAQAAVARSRAGLRQTVCYISVRLQQSTNTNGQYHQIVMGKALIIAEKRQLRTTSHARWAALPSMTNISRATNTSFRRRSAIC